MPDNLKQLTELNILRSYRNLGRAQLLFLITSFICTSGWLLFVVYFTFFGTPPIFRYEGQENRIPWETAPWEVILGLFGVALFLLFIIGVICLFLRGRNKWAEAYKKDEVLLIRKGFLVQNIAMTIVLIFLAGYTLVWSIGVLESYY